MTSVSDHDFNEMNGVEEEVEGEDSREEGEGKEEEGENDTGASPSSMTSWTSSSFTSSSYTLKDQDEPGEDDGNGTWNGANSNAISKPKKGKESLTYRTNDEKDKVPPTSSSQRRSSGIQGTSATGMNKSKRSSLKAVEAEKSKEKSTNNGGLPPKPTESATSPSFSTPQGNSSSSSSSTRNSDRRSSLRLPSALRKTNTAKEKRNSSLTANGNDTTTKSKRESLTKKQTQDQGQEQKQEKLDQKQAHEQTHVQNQLGQSQTESNESSEAVTNRRGSKNKGKAPDGTKESSPTNHESNKVNKPSGTSKTGDSEAPSKSRPKSNDGASKLALLKEAGTRVWVPHKEQAFVKATVAYVEDDSEKGNAGKDEEDDAKPMSTGSTGTTTVTWKKTNKKKGLKVHVKTDGGEEVSMPPERVELDTISDSIVAKIEDLTKLPALHEPGLLLTLHERFKRDEIYTFTGPILLAVNPFKTLPLYTEDKVSKYLHAELGEKLPPHPYAIASLAYNSMAEMSGRNQSILVSGESGAGKTETTKIVLKFITTSSARKTRRPGNKSTSIADRVLQANPLMEAFGNAKTARNDNSSRFGKMIQLHFDGNSATLTGASTATYLLEKARVVNQGPHERNFHIFYELAKGASDEQKRKWGLENLEHFNFTNQSGTYKRHDVGDQQQFSDTLAAMDIVGVTEEERKVIFSTVMAILHLGNVEFESSGKDGAKFTQMSREHNAKYAAKLLGIKLEDLETALTSRQVNIGLGANTFAQGVTNALGLSESFVRKLVPEQALEARNAIAMTLYERLFGWIVWRVNRSIAEMETEAHEEAKLAASSRSAKQGGRKGAGGRRRRNSAARHSVGGEEEESTYRYEHTIGCLDIFGFEVFEENSFEQLCINYANENLQQQFNEFVFELEQRVYQGEGIDWEFIEFPDNKACLEMIEKKPMGLFALIDEECLMPRGSDESLAAKLHKNLPPKFKHFTVSQKEKASLGFTVHHFAGPVSYRIKGFYSKNKNELHQELVDLLRSSKTPFVANLLPANANDAAGDSGGAAAAMHFDRVAGGSLPDTSLSHDIEGDGSKRATKIQQKTVGANFKQQLNVAMNKIRASQPHYIRCIKPNDENKSEQFRRMRVMEQLRYSGVLEVVKVAQAGYPTRFLLEDFASRYAVLMTGSSGNTHRSSASSDGNTVGIANLKVKQILESGDHEKLVRACTDALELCGLSHGADYQVGRTRVFLRPAAYTRLEMKKGERIERYVKRIQAVMKGSLYRIRYQRSRRSVLRMQSVYRGYRVRCQYYEHRKQRKAAVLIQKAARGFLVRLTYDPIFTKRAEAALVIHRALRKKVMKVRLRRIREQGMRQRAAVMLQSIARVVKAQNTANNLYVAKVSDVAATSIQGLARVITARKKRQELYQKKLDEIPPKGAQFFWWLVPLLILFLLANPAVLVLLVLLVVSMAIGGGFVLQQQKMEEAEREQFERMQQYRDKYGSQAQQRRRRASTLQQVHEERIRRGSLIPSDEEA